MSLESAWVVLYSSKPSVDITGGIDPWNKVFYRCLIDGIMQHGTSMLPVVTLRNHWELYNPDVGCISIITWQSHTECFPNETKMWHRVSFAESLKSHPSWNSNDSPRIQHGSYGLHDWIILNETGIIINDFRIMDYSSFIIYFINMIQSCNPYDPCCILEESLVFY